MMGGLIVRLVGVGMGFWYVTPHIASILAGRPESVLSLLSLCIVMMAVIVLLVSACIVMMELKAEEKDR
jgi:hypothetical protein